jgi:hypothetical protein
MATSGKIDRVEMKAILEEGGEEATNAALAMRYGVTIDSIRRARRHPDINMPSIPEHPVVLLTTEQAEWVERCAEEGMVSTWIAEDVGVTAGCIRSRIGVRSDEWRDEWHKVWHDIRRSSVLLALHREFAPPTTSEMKVASEIAA